MRTRSGRAAIAGLVALASSALAVVSDDFAPYDAIITRKPFGVPPPPPAPVQAPVAQPPAAPVFVKSLRLCALTETKFGLRVGFVDITQKPPKSYYMRVGEVSEDGIEVVDADYDLEGALLRKGSEEQWIYLKGDLGAGGPQPGGIARPGGGISPPGPPRTAMAGPPGAALVGPGGPGSDPTQGRVGYYARRLQRREEILEQRRKEDQERQKVGAEDLQKQLREYNLQLIRAKGQLGPPLPIPLTEEEDTQLVKEGVLPPR